MALIVLNDHSLWTSLNDYDFGTKERKKERKKKRGKNNQIIKKWKLKVQFTERII